VDCRLICYWKVKVELWMVVRKQGGRLLCILGVSKCD